MVHFDFLGEVDCVSIDINLDWYSLTFDVKVVSSLIHDNQFFVVFWVDFDVVKVPLLNPGMLFEKNERRIRISGLA